MADIKQPKKVEMPDGTTRTYHAQTIEELKQQVSVTIGVEEDEVALITEEGRPVRNTEDSIDETMRVIPKPKWG